METQSRRGEGAGEFSGEGLNQLQTFMKTRIKSLLLAMGLICLSVEAFAQDLPPLPPDIPLPPDYDPVLAQQQWELQQQQYWQRQQEIFERDFLPWLHQPMTLPNGQPYTRENEEAYRREQLLALAAELSLRHESDLEYARQQGWPLENFAGVENGLPAYCTTYDLPEFGRSFGGILMSDPAFSFGESLVISTVPEPGMLSLITIGLASFLLCHASSNSGRRSFQKSKCQLEEAKAQENFPVKV
jgi:hypothetical protein